MSIIKITCESSPAEADSPIFASLEKFSSRNKLRSTPLMMHPSSSSQSINQLIGDWFIDSAQLNSTHASFSSQSINQSIDWWSINWFIQLRSTALMHHFHHFTLPPSIKISAFLSQSMAKTFRGSQYSVWPPKFTGCQCPIDAVQWLFCYFKLAIVVGLMDISSVSRLQTKSQSELFPPRQSQKVSRFGQFQHFLHFGALYNNFLPFSVYLGWGAGTGHMGGWGVAGLKAMPGSPKPRRLEGEGSVGCFLGTDSLLTETLTGPARCTQQLLRQTWKKSLEIILRLKDGCKQIIKKSLVEQ